ncbi:MAG TPA: LLM class flavin-dependent oxidoreductase [Firmicutes bacterium]|nr:LLM class flavin-dependent oxidoreductase [Bacillota bacterium]
MRFGVGILSERPQSELATLATKIEKLGYDNIWIADERFYRDPYVTMANFCFATQRVQLGTSVTNPYTRYPAVTAAAIASLDELSGGRAVLGIGAGGSNHRMLGIKREKPAVALREAITVIRRLIAGEKVTYEGQIVKVYDAKLDFQPIRPHIPVYIAARGPNILELAGEIADGVIIGGFTSEEGIHYALEHVARGAARANRSLDDIDVVSWLYTSISDDPQAARRAVRKLVVISIINSRPIVDEIGLPIPRKLREALDRHNWSQAPDVLPEYLDLLSEEIIDRFSVSGTVADCAERIRVLSKLGIRQMAILPFATDHDSKEDVVTRFKTEVVSRAFEKP